MKKSSKAVLLSALVFPGAGHLYLKRYVVGILLSVGAVMAFYFIILDAVHHALEIVEALQNEAASLDVNAIVSLLSEQSSRAEASSLSASLNIATTVLIVVWLIGIVDSYRQGRLVEKVSDTTC
ncbi:MAG: hypothetical protein P8144_13555 [Gammaproteobacteria bacterium]